MHVNLLRQLRIELGQTQDELTERALASGRVRPTFSRTMVAKAEAPRRERLRSHEVHVALAVGLGLSVEDLDGFLAGRATLAATVARSSIRPDPEVVARLKEADARRGAKAQGEVREAGDSGEPMPHLAAAVRVAQLSGLPDAFLRHYEKSARRLGVDRPALEWVDEIRAQAGMWQRQHAAAPGSDDGGRDRSERPSAERSSASSPARGAGRGARGRR